MAEYFSHDYHARNDLKILKMRSNLGLISLGAYWSLIEILYEQNGTIKIDDLNTIAISLNCNIDLLEQIIYNFDLFNVNNGIIENNSIKKRLLVRKEKSDKASASAKTRWSKYQKNEENINVDAISNATSLTLHTTTHAKKKRKEKKEKNINTANELFSIEDRLLFDEVWVTNASKSLAIDKSRLESLVKKFNTHLLTIKKQHTNISEYASHFLNWCRISKNDNNPNKNGQITSSTPVN